MNGNEPQDPGIERMLADIRAEVAFTREYTGKDHLDPRVLRAMKKVPRHQFVPEQALSLSYDNHPLPIGHGQTISQPYIVALMTDLLEPQPEHVVLEIGTGSGYQSAVLSHLVKKVYSLEVIPALAHDAKERLARLGYDNVEVHTGDGYAGLPEHAPYNGIIVTAAAPEVPPPLLRQLAPGGRLVIPVGAPHQGQDLLVMERSTDGRFTEKNVLPVAFVPLTRAPE